jgi:hypothetical protein
MQPGVRREECPDSSCHFAVWPDTAVIQAEPEWTRWSMFCRSLTPIEVRRRLQVKTRPPPLPEFDRSNLYLYCLGLLTPGRYRNNVAKRSGVLLSSQFNRRSEVDLLITIIIVAILASPV